MVCVWWEPVCGMQACCSSRSAMEAQPALTSHWTPANENACFRASRIGSVTFFSRVSRGASRPPICLMLRLQIKRAARTGRTSLIVSNRLSRTPAKMSLKRKAAETTTTTAKKPKGDGSMYDQLQILTLKTLC